MKRTEEKNERMEAKLKIKNQRSQRTRRQPLQEEERKEESEGKIKKKNLK